MKKIALFAAACAIFAACNNNGKTASNANGQDSTADTTMTATADSSVYMGMTPAADTYGIRYHLALANDSTNGFHLEQAYMKSENEVQQASHYTGVAEIIKSKDNKTYYSFKTDGNETIKFLVVNDSTLRMVNDQLEEPEAMEGMNYDLKLQK